MGRQPHCDAPRIAAHASAELKAEEAGVQPVDPAKFLLGAPELRKLRRTNVSVYGPLGGFVPCWRGTARSTQKSDACRGLTKPRDA
jgi:hypothetical protein